MAPSTAAARQILRCYKDEILSRYYGRPATDQEIDAAIREDPSDDLALPHGALLVAHQDEAIWGCAGLRFLLDRIGEVKRVFIAPAARGRGLGARLMGEVECLAREHGLSTLRLDTRRDLAEARRLYARLGYKEVPAFNDNPYADHWFMKTLN
jgi:GNAT superfamily N-acetyltransferase